MAHVADYGRWLSQWNDTARTRRTSSSARCSLMHERRATGPAVLVCQTVPAATELALGIVSEPELGPLVVV